MTEGAALGADDAAKIARTAEGPELAGALRVLLSALRAGVPRDRLTAYRGLEAFLTARVRGLGVPRSDQDDIVSKVLEKLIARPELFERANNLAAYLSTSIRHSWLSSMRKRRREDARVARQQIDVRNAEPPSDALDELVEARTIEDLQSVALAIVGASRPDELRAQREEAWRELWELYGGRCAMGDILARHVDRDPSLSAERALDPEAAEKRARDRVLQRHHRLRKLVDATIVSWVDDAARPDWSTDRGRDARAALRLLLVRCHKRPRASAAEVSP